MTSRPWDELLDMPPARLRFIADAFDRVRAEKRCDIFRSAAAALGGGEFARTLKNL